MTSGAPVEVPDLEALIFEFGRLQMTLEEIAGCLRCSRSWVSHALADTDKATRPELAAAYRAGKAERNKSLRRRQFDIADSDTHRGSAQMAIHLGKQYLGQSDKTELAGPGGGPVAILSTNIAAADPIEAARIYAELMAVGKSTKD